MKPNESNLSNDRGPDSEGSIAGRDRKLEGGPPLYPPMDTSMVLPEKAQAEASPAVTGGILTEDEREEGVAQPLHEEEQDEARRLKSPLIESKEEIVARHSDDSGDSGFIDRNTPAE